MKHTVSWHPELCCQRCNEVIHNHFDCPKCDTYRAGTSMYRPGRKGLNFTCQQCQAEFELLKDTNQFTDTAEIKRVYEDIDQTQARLMREIEQ